MFIQLLIKYKKYVLYLLVILITIMLCIWNHNLRNELREVKSRGSNILALYDTVYIEKPFVPDESYDKKEKPSKVVIFNEPEDSISLNKEVVSVDFNTDIVKISLHDKDSVFSDNYYPIDLYKYQYRYVNGSLSKERIPLRKRFSPYVGVKYRPFNHMYDLFGGISFKTKNINYKLGLNLYYYPKISYRAGMDIELSVIYNF